MNSKVNTEIFILLIPVGGDINIKTKKRLSQMDRKVAGYDVIRPEIKDLEKIKKQVENFICIKENKDYFSIKSKGLNDEEVEKYIVKVRVYYTGP